MPEVNIEFKVSKCKDVAYPYLDTYLTLFAQVYAQVVQGFIHTNPGCPTFEVNDPHMKIWTDTPNYLYASKDTEQNTYFIKYYDELCEKNCSLQVLEEDDEEEEKKKIITIVFLYENKTNFLELFLTELVKQAPDEYTYTYRKNKGSS